MSQQILPLSDDHAERLAKHREWIAGHFDDPTAYERVAEKLRVIQTILDNNWVESNETWKLQSLGVAFGDALTQEVPELTWVTVDDESGRDPALRWLETTTLLFPLTAISRRIEQGNRVDAYEIFRGFQKALRSVLDDLREA